MQEQPLLDNTTARVFSLSAETQFAANGIVSRTLLKTPTGRVVLFGFAAGQELTEHTTTQHALVQVLSGACDFSVGTVTHALKAGDVLNLPPGVPHAVKATEAFAMLLTLFKPGTA